MLLLVALMLLLLLLVDFDSTVKGINYFVVVGGGLNTL